MFGDSETLKAVTTTPLASYMGVAVPHFILKVPEVLFLNNFLRSPIPPSIPDILAKGKVTDWPGPVLTIFPFNSILWVVLSGNPLPLRFIWLLRLTIGTGPVIEWIFVPLNSTITTGVVAGAGSVKISKEESIFVDSGGV